MTENTDPRVLVDQAFQLLSSRLEPIIAAALAPHLSGLPWVVLLEERDRARGRVPGKYIATDPQTQLKVLTERMGAIGFPLDDHTRTVSVLGGELRIARNRWAHHGELTALDAWRTNDFVVRLLTRLDDAEGAATAEALREVAFEAVLAEKGAAVHALPVSGLEISAPVADSEFGIAAVVVGPNAPSVARADEFELSTPPTHAPTLDFSVTSKAEGGEQEQVTADNEEDVFEPWPVVTVGGPDIVDALPKKAAKERVRAVAAEIIDYEGPIQLKRLAQLTAASFGIARLHAKRERSISYQIQQIPGVTVDADKFVWPEGLNPLTWRNYRPSNADQGRAFLTISRVEVANAIRAISAANADAADEDVDRAVLAVFGKSRLTSAFRAHISKARLELLV